MGVYFDFYDVEPIEHYGSHMFMLQDFKEKLHDELVKVEFDVMKYAFECKNLLDDVIFEKWHKGS